MGSSMSTGMLDSNGDEIVVQRVAVVNPDGTRADSRANYFNIVTARLVVTERILS